MERRFERIIRDISWGGAAKALAFQGLLDCCEIEKALYASGRKRAFDGVREIAIVFQAMYQEQTNQFCSTFRPYEADLTQILPRFSNICRVILRSFSEEPFANQFKDAAVKKIIDCTKNKDWLDRAPCEATEILIHEFLIDHAKRILKYPLVKASEKGHGNFEQLTVALDAILLQLRLNRLVEAIIEGHEKFPNKPPCKRENIKDIMSDSVL